MATFSDIEKKTKDYADARMELSGLVRDCENEMAAVKKRYMPFIRKAIERTADKYSKLSVAIEESPALFEKPRTIIISGIKVGFGKGKGKIEWDDDASVVKLIKRHFPEQADVLIKTEETPVKKALALLTVADLKKLGIIVEETGDRVIIKATDSEIDKLVNALLKGDEVEKEAA